MRTEALRLCKETMRMSFGCHLFYGCLDHAAHYRSGNLITFLCSQPAGFNQSLWSSSVVRCGLSWSKAQIITKRALARVYSKSSPVATRSGGGIPRDKLLANRIARVEIS